MQVYLNNIVTAILFFPVLSFIISVPYMVYQYRRYGSIPWWRTLLVYLFIFYLICAYFLVILPLPESRSAVVSYAQTPQLIPFHFVIDIISTMQNSEEASSGFLSFIKNPNIYEAVFNMALLMPLGMFLRYYFRRLWWQVLLTGFGVTLFFELSQLTGLFGIYEHPYRLFDVDDLITNTFGAMLGFWVMGPATKVLPSMKVLNQEARFAGSRVSLVRRILAFVIDFIFAGIISSLIRIVGRLFGYTLSDLGFHLGEINLFSLDQMLGFFAVFILIPVFAHGQSLGQKILKLVIVQPNAQAAQWYQIVFRYISLYLMVSVPYGLYAWLSTGEFSAAGEFSDFEPIIQILQPFLALFVLCAVFVWMVTVFVRNLRAKRNDTLFVMLNERMSGTCLMTKKGLEAVQERTLVLSVSEVTQLEQIIAKEGLPLKDLMQRAGHAVFEAITLYSETPTSVLVVCGSGNNGGDGWVVARELAEKKYEVTLVVPKLPELLVAEPARSVAHEVLSALRENDISLRIIVSPDERIMLKELKKAEIIVDALLGTGFSGREIREPYASWIVCMNRHKKLYKDSFLIAVDVPSGFSADKGTSAIPCIIADMTLTMLTYKPGLLSKEAHKYCGIIDVADLVDPELIAESSQLIRSSDKIGAL